ncbi:acyltransferase family protein [Bosea sp. PAMC 26642]|uniref:acyltransferase family protein n=1 Tax=Bosea sp. (strain PAMC 26642) TaxID=1792307 RepID=UPI00143C34B3|nr:acyltransferase [Bosea sp. PAMC 26642]
MSQIASNRQITPSSLTSIAGAAPKQALGQRYLWLQYLRGFAASAVLLYHAAHYLGELRGQSALLQVFSGAWGTYGVSIFFALSGYLMAQLISRDDPRRFLLNRIIRIYPLMLVVVMLAFAGYASTGPIRRPDILPLTLIPAGPRDYYLGVEWTLLFEMTYYVVIVALALAGLRRWLDGVFVAWLVSIPVVSAIALGPAETLTPTLTQLFGQSTNTAFVLGFLLPRVLERSPRAGILVALALPFLGATFMLSHEDAQRWTSSISATLLLAAAIKASQFGIAPVSRVGLRLGDASYALYLCHVPIILIFERFLPASMSGHWVFGIWVGASLAAAFLLAPLDLRLHIRLKRWADGLSSKALSRSTSLFLACFVAIGIFADINTRRTQTAADNARAALLANPAKPVSDLLVGLDSTSLRDDGRALLRGYGIDLRRPDEGSHIAIQQNKEIIGFDRMRRMRPNIAIEASGADLKRYRFGFSVMTKTPLDCARGPLSASLILSDGRVAPIDSSALAAMCPPHS